ncbi:MAG: VWA domain-containing protein [Bacilli bacterium]|nr:VWA domain-containing protein [Bacilli bacterium]
MSVEFEPIARKVLPIIYVIDTSGSMRGDKIASVNEAMVETVDVLREVSRENADADVKIGAITFSSGAEWVTANGLESLEDFVWNPVTEGGVTDLGAALKELSVKLSRSAFLKSDTGFAVPVIMFLSDGGPTDNWKKEYAAAMGNNWFKHARKIAIAIGADAKEDVLAQVTGNIESVIRVDDVATLKKLVVVLTATASKIGTQTHSSDAGNVDKQIVDDTMEQMGGTDARVETAPENQPKPVEEDAVSGGDDTDEDDW